MYYYKFNKFYEDYSATTNVDQIVQLRIRDHRNKTVYKKNKDGSPVLAEEKKADDGNKAFRIVQVKVNPSRYKLVLVVFKLLAAMRRKSISIITMTQSLVLAANTERPTSIRQSPSFSSLGLFTSHMMSRPFIIKYLQAFPNERTHSFFIFRSI